jgi:hypothetical protein
MIHDFDLTHVPPDYRLYAIKSNMKIVELLTKWQRMEQVKSNHDINPATRKCVICSCNEDEIILTKRECD